MSAVEFVLLVLAGAAVGATISAIIVTLRSERAARHVTAPQAQQAHHQGTQGEVADRGDAAAQVHGLPAPGHARAQVADRSPNPSVAGRADDDHELWAEPHLLPMVQASMQPGSGRETRGRDDEPAQAADRPSSQGTAAMVIAEHALDTAIEYLRRADENVRGTASVRDLDDLASAWMLVSQSAVKLVELRRGF